MGPADQPRSLEYLVSREVAVPPWTAASFALSKARELCTSAREEGVLNTERRIALQVIFLSFWVPLLLAAAHV